MFLPLLWPRAGAQPLDRPARLFAWVGASYTDLFRQTTDRSHTILFGRHASVGFGVANGEDSLVIALAGNDVRAAFSSRDPDFSVALTPRTSNFIAGWSRSSGSWSWSTELVLPTRQPFLDPRGRASISLGHLAPYLSVVLEASSDPGGRFLSVGVEDYAMRTDEFEKGWRSSVRLTTNPVRRWRAMFEGELGETTVDAAQAGYATPSRTDERKGRLSIGWTPRPWRSIEVRAGYGEARIDASASLDGASFGRFPACSIYLRSAGIGWAEGESALAVDYVRVHGSFVGAIESWPFTPLASSVFSNRLNVRGRGSVEGYRARLSSEMGGAAWGLRPGFSVARLRTDVVTDRWEPEFLVFGVKNFRSEPLNIVAAWLLSVSVSARVPFGPFVIGLDAEQYLPVSVSYRSTEGVGGGSGAGQRTRTDGGRRIAVSVSWSDPF